MHKHHIVPRHVWLSRFGNLKGFNAPDNKTTLTIEQHAQAHQFLYELHGRKEDLIAWKGLAGIIGHEEIIAERNRINGLATKGRKRSPEAKERSRQAALLRWNKPGEREAQRARNLGINNPCYGKLQSMESNQKRSATQSGVPKSEEHKKKISDAQIGVPRPQTTGKLNGNYIHGRHTKAV